MLAIDTLAVGPFAANCYLVRDRARPPAAPGAQRLRAGQALVIDPGADAAAILDMLEKQRVATAAYLLTHGHVDHVSALADVCARHPAPYAMHALDFRWAFAAANQLPPYYPSAPRQPAGEPLLIEDQQIWSPTRDLTCRIIAAPGHSPGGICAYFENDGVLFTGDTLFRESVGRTDLPGGNQALLEQALENIARLPPSTRIYPGHGPATTLAAELESNPFLGG